MAYQYPYDEELRRVPLNPEMIRHRVQKDCRRSLLFLFFSTPVTLFLILGFILLVWSFVQNPPDHMLLYVLQALLTLLPLSAVGLLIYMLIRSVSEYRRATRGELLIEIDKLGYIEHDRPRVVYRSRHRHTIYEDFMHFQSGREFKAKENMRHLDLDGEEFITVAFAANPEHILFIYRLQDYNWQP